MLKRRDVLKSVLATGILTMTSADASNSRWRAPAEEAPHAATWMAWPHNVEIYGDPDYFADVQVHLGRLARAISKFEPVRMAGPESAFGRIRALCGHRVQPVAIRTNDMWMRDSGPVFVTDDSGNLGALDLNFNGWGDKQEPREDDAQIAQRVASHLQIPRLATPLVGEGGGLEYDGDGTLLLTDGCRLNNNRNPGVSRAAIPMTTQSGVRR